MAELKKVMLKKKIGASVYQLVPQTTSDIVTHITTDNTSTTVETLLNECADKFGTFSTPAGGSQNTTVMQEIAYQVNEAKKQILGVDNQSSITAAYDTIVELANALAGVGATYGAVTPEGSENPSEEGWFEKNGNDEYVATSDTSVDGGKTYYENTTSAVVGLVSKVATLQNEVETATTGLLDRVSALETTIDTATTGLSDRVAALETFANVGATLHVLASTSTDSDVTNENDLYFVELA